MVPANARQAAPPAAAMPWALLAWLAFIVYGSLLPFYFQPLPWHEALQRLAAAPLIELGVTQRADWLANGVLFLPAGLLLARQAIGHGRMRWLPLVLAWGVALALAVAVELAQLAFPPRSVSRNDLLAEAIGAGLGVLAWPLLRWQLAAWHDGWRQGGLALAGTLLSLYVVAYPLLSLFPYDLLIDAEEWQAKIDSGRWGWLWADGASPARHLAQATLEIVLALPIGAWLARRQLIARGRNSLSAALLLGVAIGLFIELGQLATASGISQGLSVWTRGAGAVIGAALGGALWPRAAEGLALPGLSRWRWPLLLGWLALLLLAQGFARPLWPDAKAIGATWNELHLLPLHYHYFTTEALALASLGRVALAYLPAAVVGSWWGWSARRTAGAAALLALALEAGKLLVVGARPDPTNLLIAAAAAGLGRLMLSRLAQRPQGPLSLGVRSLAAPSVPALALLAALAALLAHAAWQAWHFPAYGGPLLLALAVAAALAAWRPALTLVLLPAALPLDLAMWSGRTLWDEFDLLAVTTLSVALWRTPPRASTAPDRKADALAALFALSLLLAAIVAAAGSQAGPDAAGGWWGAAGAWRVLKGALAAAATLCLWRRLASGDAQASRWFEIGLMLGLGLVVASVLWERAAFVSLWSTSSAYRVTGPFSAMLRGGAYVEAFLAVGWAYALARVWRSASLRARMAWLFMAGATGYSLAVTWSRGGWWAMAVATLAMLLALWRSARAERAAPLARQSAGRHWALAAAIVGLLVALPFLASPLAGYRLAQWDEDLEARADHWADAWAFRDPGLPSVLFGSGLGGFAQAHYWRSREGRHAGGFSLEFEPGNRFLRLGGGASIYVEQWFELQPGATLSVSMRLRHASPEGEAAPGLAVGLCEKWMLTSLRCAKASVPVDPAPGWHERRVVLDTRELAPPKRPLPRPLKLAVWIEGAGTLDVDDIRPDGAGMVAPLPNGGFESGWDHWLWATDVAPPWQIDQMGLALLWQQGVLGLASFAGLVMLALVRGLRRLWRGDATAAAPVAAMLALLGLGTVSTVIDVPRFLWLMLVLLWWCGHQRGSLLPIVAPTHRRRRRFRQVAVV